MSNFYYYFFYTLSKFFKWANRREKDMYIISAYLFLSLCACLNILSIIFYLKATTSIEINFYSMAIFIYAPVLVINYFLLMKNGKGKKIFSYYDNKFMGATKKTVSTIAIITYIFFTFALCTLFAYINRTHLNN